MSMRESGPKSSSLRGSLSRRAAMRDFGLVGVITAMGAGNVLQREDAAAVPVAATLNTAHQSRRQQRS